MRVHFTSGSVVGLTTAEPWLNVMIHKMFAVSFWRFMNGTVTTVGTRKSSLGNVWRFFEVIPKLPSGLKSKTTFRAAIDVGSSFVHTRDGVDGSWVGAMRLHEVQLQPFGRLMEAVTVGDRTYEPWVDIATRGCRYRSLRCGCLRIDWFPPDLCRCS